MSQVALPELNQRIGDRLRQLRTAQGWSLDRLAGACGVSKAMLGQIERGESSPTVVTLWKIAAGLACSFSSLLGDLPEPAVQGEVRRLGEGVAVTTLLPFDGPLGCECLLVELPVGCEYRSVPHLAGVVEDILPLSAGVEIWLAGAWQPVAPGTALRFAADQPHGYRNVGPMPARFHNLIHYPSA